MVLKLRERKTLFWIVLFLTSQGVWLDQQCKRFASTCQSLPRYIAYDLFLFDVQPSLNRGLIFGLGQSISPFSVLFLNFSLLIFFLACLIKIKPLKQSVRFDLGGILILSGGFSNLLGRWRDGGVWDYIRIGFPSLRRERPFFHQFSFNIADLMIALGFYLLIEIFSSKQFLTSTAPLHKTLHGLEKR